MQRQERVPDEVLSQKVSQVLTSRGIRLPCQVRVSVNKGDVTLSGTVQYEVQRRIALHAARGVQGVHRVMDRLQVKPAFGGWSHK